MASYVTVDEANALIKELFISSDTEYKVWNALDENDKQVLLNRASSKLIGENHFLWHGKKVDSTQELDFPRLYKGKIINFDKLMMIGLLNMLLREEVDKSSEYSDMRKERIKRFSDGGGMTVEFSDSAISSATVGSSGSNFSDLHGVPIDIFRQYFIDKSYIV